MDEEDEYLYGEGQKPRREERDPRKRKRLVRPKLVPFGSGSGILPPCESGFRLSHLKSVLLIRNTLILIHILIGSGIVFLRIRLFNFIWIRILTKVIPYPTCDHCSEDPQRMWKSQLIFMKRSTT
jgi:hypothetical protein